MLVAAAKGSTLEASCSVAVYSLLDGGIVLTEITDKHSQTPPGGSSRAVEDRSKVNIQPLNISLRIS